MSTWRLFVVCGCTVLLLSSCQSSPPKPNEIYKQVKKSIVLISYQNKSGQGTGFFVQEKGNKPGCNILTARHVVPIQNNIKLRTSDQENWQVSDIQRFPNHDLAVINFKIDNKNECPYKALNLGDSDSVKVSESIYIAGIPGNSSVTQFTSGRVSYIGGDIDGYGISYDVTTAAGMSGSPVINTWGKVIAVHKGKQGIFNGGVRIKAYKENIPKVSTKSQPVLKAEDFYNQGNDLLASNNYQKALESYNKAIAIKPDYYLAWDNRGVSLRKLKRYEEAIESYDKVIAIKPDDYLAWNNRGFSMYNLKRYEEAIKSYDKAITIKPDYHLPWSNRGNALSELKLYPKAIQSYNEAVKIKHDYDEAWYKRGNALSELELYQEAIESYDKAIKFNPNNEKAINNRKRLLKKINKNRTNPTPTR